MNPDQYTQMMMRDNGRQQLSFSATDLPALQLWQQTLRKKLRESLGIHSITSRCHTTPGTELLETVTLDDHVREDWRIESEPGIVIPFYLLRPLGPPETRPLVITPHGHSRNHRHTYAGAIPNDPEVIDGERDIARQAVREGYIAIAPQARAFGDNRSDKNQKNNSVSSCAEWQHRSLMFGRTLIGERVWDTMKLIDFALANKMVDPQHIMLTGNSGGGTTSLFTAAIDERVTSAAPSCYFCTFADSIGAMEHCACNYIPGILNLAEMSDIAGLIAPRPLLIVAGLHDPIFPIHAVRSSFKKLKDIYTLAGAPDKCQLYIGKGGHRYYKKPVWSFAKELFNSTTLTNINK